MTSAITSYVIQYTDVSNNWLRFPEIIYTVGANVPPFSQTVVYGILNGYVYYVRIAAINGFGRGSFSYFTSINKVATPGAIPRALDYLNGNFGNMKVALGWGWTQQPGEVYGQWTGGRPILYYILNRYVSPGNTNAPPVFDASFSITRSTYTDYGLVNGSNYTYYVRAVNVYGPAPADVSLSIIPGRPPSQVVAVQGSTFDQSVGLSWTPPYDNGGLPIVQYPIQYLAYTGPNPRQYAVTDASWNSLVAAGATVVSVDTPADINGNIPTNYRVGGLTNGTFYIMRVSAVTFDARVGQFYGSYGTGYDASGRYFNSYTPYPVVAGTVPSIVSNLAVSYYGDQTVTLQWGVPAFYGSNPVLTYTVIVSGGDLSYNRVITLPARASTMMYTIDASGSDSARLPVPLNNGVTYTFTVYSTNIIGSTNMADYASVTGKPGRRPYDLSANLIVGVSKQLGVTWPDGVYSGGYPVLNYFIQIKETARTDASYVTYSMMTPTPVSQNFTSQSNGVGTPGFQLITASKRYNTFLTAFPNPMQTYSGGQFTLRWSLGGQITDPSFVDISYGLTMIIYVTNAAGGLFIPNVTRRYSTNHANPAQIYSDTFDVSGVTIRGTDKLYFQLSVDNVGTYSLHGKTMIVNIESYSYVPNTPYYFTTAIGATGMPNDIGTVYAAPTSLPLPTTYTLPNLTNGVSYDVRVAAINQFGINNYSPVARRVCGRTPFKVGFKQVDFYESDIAIYRDNYNIVCYWTNPDSGGYPLTGYNIQYTDDISGVFYNLDISNNFTPEIPASQVVFGNYKDILITTIVSGNVHKFRTFQTTASHPLGPDVSGAIYYGRRYYVRIAGINALGVGEYSDVYNTIPGTLPNSVQNLGIIIGNITAKLIWQVPYTDGGYPIQDYLIEYKKNTDIHYTPAHAILFDENGLVHNVIPPAPIQSMPTTNPYYVDLMTVTAANTAFVYNTAPFGNQFNANKITLGFRYNYAGAGGNGALRPQSFNLTIMAQLNGQTGPVLMYQNRHIDISGQSTADDIVTYSCVFTPITTTDIMRFTLTTDSVGDASNGYVNIALRSYEIDGVAPISTYPGMQTKFAFTVGDPVNPLSFNNPSAMGFVVGSNNNSLTYYTPENNVLYTFRVVPKTYIDYAVQVDASNAYDIRIGTTVAAPVADLVGDISKNAVRLRWTYGNPNLSYDFRVYVDGYSPNIWPIIPDKNYSITTFPVPIGADISGSRAAFQYVISSLTNGQIYYFEISPAVLVSSNGYEILFNSPASNRAMVWPGDIPKEIKALSIRGNPSGSDPTSMYITWSAGMTGVDPNAYYNYYNGETKFTHPILGFIVYYTANYALVNSPSTAYFNTSQLLQWDGSMNVPSTYQSPVYNTVVTGLTPEATYYFAVVTYNDLGPCLYNNMDISGIPSKYPYLSSNFGYVTMYPGLDSTQTRNQINVSFNLPTYTGNASAYTYLYEYSTGASGPWTAVFTDASDVGVNALALYSENQAQNVLVSTSTPTGSLYTTYIKCKSGVILGGTNAAYIRLTITGINVYGASIIPGLSTHVPFIIKITY